MAEVAKMITDIITYQASSITGMIDIIIDGKVRAQAVKTLGSKIDAMHTFYNPNQFKTVADETKRKLLLQFINENGGVLALAHDDWKLLETLGYTADRFGIKHHTDYVRQTRTSV